ncbi:MAG: RHS repeat-associated core domain-containing protein [Bacteroidota bacterium]
MRKIQYACMIILLLCLHTNTWAKKISPLIEYKAMDSLGTDQSISRASDLLAGVSTNPFPISPTWKTGYCFNSAQGTLVLRFKNGNNKCVPTISNYQINVRISYLTIANDTISIDTTLNINYNNTKGQAYKERAIYVKQNVHYLKAKVLSVSDTSLNKYVCLEAIIEEDRNYCGFSPTDLPTFTTAYQSTTDEITVSFTEAYAKKCDYIEVEYQFIDAYNTTALTSYLPKSAIWFDFRHNATRVAITSNNFNISNIFEDGYLIIRARGVVFANQNQAILGNWNLINNGNLGTISTTNIVNIGMGGSIAPKEPNINWQYQAEFAEEAKKKEVMTFFDGLLKNRQTVTRSNTENTAIVAENIYDHIGRPAIATLPAPSFENKIKFYPDFNRGPWSAAYFPQNFEYTTDENACTANTSTDDPMSNATGATKYYSNQNPLLTGTTMQNHLASFIPNAGGYPFMHTEYMPDQTSRVRRQSGAGDSLNMGIGHETKYFYGVPTQIELDKLFGTEVGKYKHYKKNMVVDPNGQVSISYLDAKGRVIATNLAGTNQTNLKPLPNNNGSKDTLEMRLNEDIDTTLENGALIISKTFNIVEQNTNYEFKYSLQPQSYIPLCNQGLVCYNCVYNLNITLVDNACGNTILDINRKIGGSADTICDDPTAYSFKTDGTLTTSTDSFISVSLATGNYTLSKKLSVNNIAFEYYLNDYLNNRLCLTKDSFIRRAYQKFDTTQCEQTCETCMEKLGTLANYVNKRATAQIGFGYTLTTADTTQFNEDYNTQKSQCDELCKAPKTGCDVMLEVLKSDVKPGGQYAKYTFNETSNTLEADNTSGNTHNLFFTPNTNLASGFDTTYKNHPYFVNNGITINGAYKTFANFTVDELIKNWQDTFTNILVTQHPEYCKYLNCVNEGINDTFMDNFMNTETYAQANARGYLDPVGSTIKDPFFKSGKIGNTILTDFRDRLINYVTFLDVSTSTYKGLSIMDIAVSNMYCSSQTNTNDLLTCISANTSKIDSCTDNQNYYWNIYKGLYNALRQKVTDSLSKTITYKSSLCNNDRVWANYAIRFPDNTLQDSVGGDINNPSEVADITQKKNDLVADNCLKTCQGYIPQWYYNLKGCNLNSTDSAAVMNDLVQVCMVECSESNPFGASTISDAKRATATQYSFNEVLKGIKHPDGATQGTNLYVPGICDDILITMPMPLGHDYLSYNNPMADTCACDVTKYNYISPTCIDTVVTPNPQCSGCANDPNLNIIVKNTIAQLRNSENKYKCKNCIDCCKFKEKMSLFVVDYSFLVASGHNAVSKDQKCQILTNYLNKTFGFNLTYQEYLDFGANCLDTASTFEAITAKAAMPPPTGEGTHNDCSGVLPVLSPAGRSFFAMNGERLYGAGDPHTSYDRNSMIDTCGCNRILKAEKDYANGFINTTLYKSAQDYVERTFNCGMPLAQYASYKTSCQNAVDYWLLHTNNPSVYDIRNIAYTADSSFNWDGSRQFYLHWGDSIETSMEYVLHGFAIQFTWQERLYNINSCDSNTCNTCKKLCNKPINEVNTPYEDPCKVRIKALANIDAENAFTWYRDSSTAAFKAQYYRKCLRPLQIENMVERYQQPQYQYTLYYYDQAGNLAKTVPPKGVKPLNNTDALQVQVLRQTASSTLLTPSHQMATLYKYNTLQNLTWQKTPDAGISQFYYDQLGRLVVSQNAKQGKVGNNQYSYTLFDNLGRITEVGQVVNTNPISDATASNPSSLATWLTTTNKAEITRTYYDEANYSVVDTILFKPQNLRSRVVYTTYASNNNGSNYDHATHYSYDIHGNVKQLLREIKALKTLGQDYKIVNYDYDLVSGKVNNVYYQQGQADQYMHRYQYDAENRLVGVQSGPTTAQLDQDAAYYYYMHGPLARVELGYQKVQGTDYAYTLQGWLKGVNSTHLNSLKDIGRDGYQGSSGYNGNGYIPADEFGFALNYYEGDYSPVGSNITTSNSFTASTLSAAINTQAPNLYNGNIRMMAVAIKQFGNLPIANAYQYDQLNRLVESNTWNNYDSVNNKFASTGSALSAYKNTFTYDENGNILKQLRNGSSTQTNLDSLNYRYYMDGSEPTNKLRSVSDNVSNSNYTDDIDNQPLDNYSYDEIGNLIKDSAEQIKSIEWTVYGKIRKITRTTGSTKPDLEFEYSPDGHRVVKIVKPKDGSQSIYTYYVRDAQGNILATYTRNFSKTIDYDSISYTQINNKILSVAGYNAFANLTTTYSNNAGLKDYLLSQLGTEEALLRSFNPYYLLTNHPTALDQTLSGFSNYDYVDIFLKASSDFSTLCDCFKNAKNASVISYNLKEALFQSSYGINILLEDLLNKEPSDLVALANSYGYEGEDPGGALIYLNELFHSMDTEQRNKLMDDLDNYIDYDNCNEIERAMHDSYNRGHGDVVNALAAVAGIRSMFYDNSATFGCDIRLSQSAAISHLSTSFANEVWTSLLTSYSVNDLLTWLRNNDPDFLYKASYYSPGTVSTYQAANNLYGGPYGGKQNYFVNMRASLGQTNYDIIVAYFLGQSSRYIDSMNLSEWHLYGNGRLGIYQTTINMAYRNIKIIGGVTTDSTSATVAMPSYTLFDIQRGSKRYELKNHLGNVLVVVSDKKIQQCSSTVVTSYLADVVSANDYSPFGAPLAGRSYTAPNTKYRFGFNGKENDDETQTQDYGMRIYNYKLGRFLSVDPLSNFYAWNSTYAFAENVVISCIDLDGLEKQKAIDGVTIVDGPWDMKQINKSEVVQANIIKQRAMNAAPPIPKLKRIESNPVIIENKPLTEQPWYDLSGGPATNDGVYPGGPDAAGATLGVDVNFLGAQFGRSVSRYEVEEGHANYTTGKVAGQNNLGISVKGGLSLDFYWKTDAGENEKVSNLLLGESTYFSAGGGVMVTLSWTKNAEDRVTLFGLNVSLGAGISSGKQVTEKLDSNTVGN